MTITEGVPFSHLVTFSEDGTPMDLTGYTFKAQVRARHNEGAVVFSISVVQADLANGQIRLEISKEDTAAPIHFGAAVFDLVATSPDGGVIRTDQQSITIKRGVTR